MKYFFVIVLLVVVEARWSILFCVEEIEVFGAVLDDVLSFLRSR
jgi:positive regulator of sigma E activity